MFTNFKVALNPLLQFFLNYTKSYILVIAYCLHFNNKSKAPVSQLMDEEHYNTVYDNFIFF